MVISDEFMLEYRKKIRRQSHPLLWIAKEGELNFMLRYLENVDKSEVHDELDGETALHVLLRQQLNRDDVYKEQRALLPKVVKRLLELGANPNKPDKKRRTPLWMAVLANEHDVVNVMVEVANEAIDKHFTGAKGFNAQAALARIANPNMESSWSKNEQEASLRGLSNLGASLDGQELDVFKSSWHIAVDKEVNGIKMLDMLVSLQVAGSLLCYTLNGGSKGGDDKTIWEEFTYHSRRDAKRPSNEHQKCWVKEGSPLHLVFRDSIDEQTRHSMLEILLREHSADENANTTMTLFHPHALDGQGRTALKHAAHRIVPTRNALI